MKYLFELQYTTSSGDFGYESIDTMTIECDDIQNFFEKTIKELPEYSYNIIVVDINPRQFFDDYPSLNYQVLTDMFDVITYNINSMKSLQESIDILNNNILREEERLSNDYYQKQLENMKIKHAKELNIINDINNDIIQTIEKMTNAS